MHVVFLSPHSDPKADLGEQDAGGQCLYEDQLADSLAQLGITVTTMCRDSGSSRPSIEKVHELYTIHRIECGGRKFIPKEDLEEYLPEFARKAKAILSEYQSTSQNTVSSEDGMLLHGHYWDGAKVGLMLKNQTNLSAPFVWTPHSLGAQKRTRFLGLKNELHYNFIPRLVWENYALFFAEQIIVSSPLEKNIVLQNYAKVNDTIKVIPPGITIRKSSNTPKKKSTKKKKVKNDNLFTLLCLGRMVPNKGFHHGIQILKRLQIKQSAREYHLTIIGGSANPDPETETGKYQVQLRNLVQKLALQEHVQFMEAIDHDKVGDYFSSHDLFLMTSENEPFGLTILEAMSVGTPVLAHNVGGPSEIIDHQQNGFLGNIRQYEQMATLIDQLTPKTLQRIGQNAAEMVKSKYSWRSRAKDFLRVYHNARAIHSPRLFREALNKNYFLQKNLSLQNNG